MSLEVFKAWNTVGLAVGPQLEEMAVSPPESTIR